jgi:hypothetical protein
VSKPNGRPPAADRDAILADYAEGLHVRVIAEKHGVSKTTVSRYARHAEMTGRTNPGCRCRSDYLCANCKFDIPLTGGAWVLDPRRRVLVWVEYADAS